MRRIVKNFNLKTYNTFNIEAYSSIFFMFTDIIELKAFLKNEQFLHLQKRVLGGGSNVLITHNFEGAIIHPTNNDLKLQKTHSSNIVVKVGAGLNWDSFVEYALNNKWYGLENLSGIPGNVGAAPIQNIGAYGVEAKDSIRSVEAIDIETHKIVKFSNAECRFGYRDSIFKQELKNKMVITAVTFELCATEKLILNYRGISEALVQFKKIDTLNLRQAILKLRASKIPKPEISPNAGSFFKNPILKIEDFKNIHKKFSQIPSHKLDDDFVKIPAAWLIDQAGFKGYKNGKTAVNEKQPLILINMGGASADDLLRLSEKIYNKVKSQFNIELEKEVNLFP